MIAVGEHVFDDLDERCIRMTTAFGGGVGGTRDELCGSLAAGVMLIGGLYGRVSPQVDDSHAYALAKALRERFLSRFQSTTCSHVRERAKKPDGSSGCDEVVAESVRLLLGLLAEPAS